MMNKKIIYTVLVILFAGVSFAANEKEPENKIVAKVNGQPVYESEVEDKIKKLESIIREKEALTSEDNKGGVDMMRLPVEIKMMK